MSFNLRHHSFLKEFDFTPAELRFLLTLAADLKTATYAMTNSLSSPAGRRWPSSRDSACWRWESGLSSRDHPYEGGANPPGAH